MEYRRNEIRAGVFLLVSFAILVVMIFAVSDIQSLSYSAMGSKKMLRYGTPVLRSGRWTTFA
jgi:ABC-type transporter Mla subunit MlaD